MKSYLYTFSILTILTSSTAASTFRLELLPCGAGSSGSSTTSKLLSSTSAILTKLQWRCVLPVNTEGPSRSTEEPLARGQCRTEIEL